MTFPKRYVLYTILQFLEEKFERKDFIFVYTLPSIYTGLYYHDEKYENNIVYEELSLHHAFKLYDIYIRLKILDDKINEKYQRTSRSIKEVKKKEQIRTMYNNILIVLGQIGIRKLLPPTDLEAFNTLFTIDHVRKGHSDMLVEQTTDPKAEYSILTIISKLLFNLVKKHRLIELFNIETYQAMIGHIQNPKEFFFKFNTLRAAFINRQIEDKKETNSGPFFMFVPYNSLCADHDMQDLKYNYDKYIYDAINESGFTMSKV
jgi:hypothetical protein